MDRYERRGSSVIFYLNKVYYLYLNSEVTDINPYCMQLSNNPVKLTLEMRQNMVVNDPQYSPVTVLDYYDPGMIGQGPGVIG